MKIKRLPKKCSWEVERDFPSEIKRMRIECGLTQEELAKEIGLKTSVSVSLYESGKRQPSLKVLWRICSVCNHVIKIEPLE